MELQAQIHAFERQVQELEQKREFDVTFIEEILGLTRNIYKAYKEAPSFLKRHYLRFFFEKFTVKDKKVATVIPSPLFAALQKEHKIIIRSNLLATWNDYGKVNWLQELEYPELTLNQLNKFNN